MPALPLPLCLVNGEGKIVAVNEHIEQVFPYGDLRDADFFALTGVKADALKEGEKPVLKRNDSAFELIGDLRQAEDEEQDLLLVLFHDVTRLEACKTRYEEDKICVLRINVDNYDEFIDTVDPDQAMAVSSQVAGMIQEFALKIGATLEQIRTTLYVLHFHAGYFAEISKSKFDILDRIRAIDTGIDFPLTLSIGVGAGGDTIYETNQFAMAALDLALARGGDQAVVREGEEFSFYGGKSQSIEKGTKGKSRVVGLALNKIIEQAKRVVIMGHRHADMDAFSSALGIYRMCINAETEAYIAIDVVAESMQELYDQARKANLYHFASTEKARTLLGPDTVLVVVDTQNPNYLEDRTLLERADVLVVIDHHIRTEEYIEGAALSYIETYASSTAELVTEMLQYVIPKKSLPKLEAEALLAGISVDTNSFSIKTGVRTFEAAAWLRRAGADTTEVKRFFQTSHASFQARVETLSAAVFHEAGYATSVMREASEEAQVICAQVADELLSVKDIRVSFVAGKNERGVCTVSCRSTGDINVQILAEALGGGGHFNIAGAQVEAEPEEVINKLERLVKESLNESNSEE